MKIIFAKKTRPVVKRSNIAYNVATGIRIGARDLIVNRSGSCDHFNLIYGPRPYVGGFINFIKDCKYPHINLDDPRLLYI